MSGADYRCGSAPPGVPRCQLGRKPMLMLVTAGRRLPHDPFR